MVRLSLVLALAASLVSGCVRPIFDGRSTGATGASSVRTDTTGDMPEAGASEDAHTRAFGI